MDYTTTKLAQDLVVSHESVVKTIKRYESKYQLITLKLGTTDMDGGPKQTVYQFSKSAYDDCCVNAVSDGSAMRAESAKRGKEAAADPNSGLNRWRRFDESATEKQKQEYKRIDNRTADGREERTAYLDKFFSKKK